MSELCARPGCSVRAVATFTFDGLERIVWVNHLAEAAAYSAGDLCQRHADLLSPPRHWILHDTRTDGGSTEPSGAAAPSRHHAPADAPEPPAEQPATPVTEPAARLPIRTLEARTPMLARAFRGATPA